MASNKKLGNDFEREFCEILSDNGYWIHNFQQNADGQPADVIALKNGAIYLIDCKVVTGKRFPFIRIEENQKLAMKEFENNGGTGYFALKTNDGVYLMSLDRLSDYEALEQKSISVSAMKRELEDITDWVERDC